MPDLIEGRPAPASGREADLLTGVIVQLGEIGCERVTTQNINIVPQRLQQLAGGEDLPRRVLPLTLEQRSAAHFQGDYSAIQDRNHDIGAGLRGIGGRLAQRVG
jgi:hypothetical protein